MSSCRGAPYSVAFLRGSFPLHGSAWRSGMPVSGPQYMKVSKRHESPVVARKGCPTAPIQMRWASPMGRAPVSGMGVISIPGLGYSRIPPLIFVLVVGVVVVRAVRRWLMFQFIARQYNPGKLNARIADFYDERSTAWEIVWGEHMHHGLYFGPKGYRDKPLRGQDAQIETMNELLRFGGLEDPRKVSALASGKQPKILDVGCGIGGASRFLATKFSDANVTGITLSPRQAQRASELNAQAGLSSRVSNVVCDALNMDFPSESFDIVWSLESAEHMPDKHRLIAECLRVLKPGGTLVMLAWCIRECSPPLMLQERVAIRHIMSEYCLPRLASQSEYTNIMRRMEMQGVAEEDWTARAAPFWGEVVRSAFFNPKGLLVLWKYGWPLVRSALAMRHVISAIRMGCFRLCAMSARKPTLAELKRARERAAEISAC